MAPVSPPTHPPDWSVATVYLMAYGREGVAMACWLRSMGSPNFYCYTSAPLLDRVSQEKELSCQIVIFLTVDNDESVKKMLLHALAIGKYSCETFSTSFKTISVSSTFCMISDASVLIFSKVEITLIG
jgi:hypothetical protein